MIVGIKLSISGKIKNLTPEKIHVPCDCKVLKIDFDDPDVDAYIELCQVHEVKKEQMESGQIKEKVLIPGLKVDQE